MLADVVKPEPKPMHARARAFLLDNFLVCGFCLALLFGLSVPAAGDEVLEVDAEKKLLRVQAGARVREVVEALRPHGLTLQNYASIREQQMGGFTQVGAHGTGARIPPVDETVVEMKLVTPARGTLTLSATSEPELFKLAKCGIGALGAVTELTIKCVGRRGRRFVRGFPGMRDAYIFKFIQDLVKGVHNFFMSRISF